MSNENYDFLFRVVLIGDSGTGKTQLLRRVVFDQFTQSEETVGVDFKSKVFTLDPTNLKVRLNFYDTSGKPQYRQIFTSYLYYAQTYLVFYDINNEQSFTNCNAWLDEIVKNNYQQFFKHSSNEPLDKNLIKVLVGCKYDLLNTSSFNSTNEQKKLLAKAAISSKKARQYAKKNGFLLFYETSSKWNFNLKQLFDELCFELVKNYKNYINFRLSEYDIADNVCAADLRRALFFTDTNMNWDLVRDKSLVHFNTRSQSLNSDHIVINIINAKRKNLQEEKQTFLEYLFS